MWREWGEPGGGGGDGKREPPGPLRAGLGGGVGKAGTPVSSVRRAGASALRATGGVSGERG